MKIQEIPEDSRINITVTREDTSAAFSSTIAHSFSDCIFVEPFMYEDNLIAFDTPGIIIEMVVTREGEVPYVWKSVQITKEVYENKVYHCIKAGTIGVKLNRRNAFRVFIGENGSAMEVPGNARLDVLVKDISSTGIGILIDDSLRCDLDVGKHVQVMFSDSVISANFNVTARVVRIVPVEDKNQHLYGCQFSKHYPQIDRYCAAKQIKNRKPATKKPRNEEK